LIKHTLEISQGPAHLCVRLGQLVIRRGDETLGRVPIEDVGILVVDHPSVTYTHATLAQLADHGAVVVVCGANHLPAAVVQPMADHTQIVWRLEEQLAVGTVAKKQLWRQIVQAKIRAQAANLQASCPGRAKLLAMARNVRSGDASNREAQAAKVYWKHWLPGEPFRRDPDGDGLNVLLNYGYAIVRAAVARALVAGGLLPALGLHHSNRGNAFCLADDLIEPLRPLVDAQVRSLHDANHAALDQPAKAGLLELLAEPVQFGNRRGPLMVNLHRTVASLARCLRGESQTLEFPKRCSSQDTEACGSG